MVRKPHCGPMSRYFWWPFEWPFAMDLRRWINQTYHPLLYSNGQFKPVQNGYSGQFTEPPTPYPLMTVMVVLKQAFIGGLGVTAVKERIASRTVRNQGYLLTKTLKTHNLAFTTMFHRPLSQRLISGWLLIVFLWNNDPILFILVWLIVWKCFLWKWIKINQAASIIWQMVQN